MHFVSVFQTAITRFNAVSTFLLFQQSRFLRTIFTRVKAFEGGRDELIGDEHLPGGLWTVESRERRYT